MRLRLIAAAATSVVLVAAAPLRADTSILARAGNWEAFGGTTTQGKPVCGVSQTMDDGRYVSVKFFNGDDTFTLQIGWKQWRIKDGDKQAIHMTLDSNALWKATATGFHFNDGDAGLEFTIIARELDEFVREFRNSSVMRLQFPGSGAQDWSVSLSGTSTVSDAFDRCRRNL